MVYLLGIIISGISAVLILSNWRRGIVMIFIWLLLEDVVRRLLPGQPAQVMLIKDGLVALTYSSFLFYFFSKNKKIWKPAFTGVLLILAAFFLLDSLNPNSPGPLFGLIGLRSYLWYLPLIFLGYYMFDSQEKLLKFCRWLVYLSIPLFLFAVFQYLFYGTGWALVRPFESATQAHSFQVFIGSIARSWEAPFLSSVFGMGQRYSRFSMLLFFLGLGLLASRYPNKNKGLLLAGTSSAFLGIILSSTRTAFALSLAGAALFSLMATFLRNNEIRYLWKNKKIVIFSLIFLLIMAAALFLVFENSIFYQISTFYFVFKERLPWVLEGFGNALANASFFGMGTGTWSQGLYDIPGGREWIAQNSGLITEGFRFETGFGKIIFELGIFGLVVFYLFWLALFFQMRKDLKFLRNSNLRNLGLAILIFSFLMLFWFTFVHNQVFGDATTLTVLWFFLGVFFSLKRLNKTA